MKYKQKTEENLVIRRLQSCIDKE